MVGRERDVCVDVEDGRMGEVVVAREGGEGGGERERERCMDVEDGGVGER